MRGARVAAVGLLTGWGEGTQALPEDARRSAGGRPVVPLRAPARDGERFRRATRECLLGVGAAEALLSAADLSRADVAGDRTALVYTTAAGYGASNRGFIEGRAGALGFPYTAPSAVPAEVAIEFHLTGSYVILIGGAATTIDALWQASVLIGRGAAERALVMAVETFEECADLFLRGRWLVHAPLVEAAACALLVPGDVRPLYRPVGAAAGGDDKVRRRAGETLACGPLIALALALDRGEPLCVTGEWRGRRAALEWPAAQVDTENMGGLEGSPERPGTLGGAPGNPGRPSGH
jgi:hypothetical protein